jgi:tRNA dimethylallyltransferase
MTSLGYREMMAYLQGSLSLDEAVARIKTETHRFVRHQMTWFRKMPDLHWFDLALTPASEIERYVTRWLSAPDLPAFPHLAI